MSGGPPRQKPHPRQKQAGDTDAGSGSETEPVGSLLRGHPAAGTIIQPSRSARLRVALLAVAMLVPMLSLLPVLNRYQTLGLMALAEPELMLEFERVRAYLLLIFSGVVMIIWYLAYALARLARNIGHHGCYPPPSSSVLFPTEVVVGRQCAMIRRFCNLSALVLLLLAGLFFFGLMRLYTESTELLTGLQLMVDFYGR